MARETIPKKTKDAVLGEYNHRCAICGSDKPHLHHIDEVHSNSDPLNLLPLCPNCHLTDQHNPTRRVEIPKLQLFRQYKDPAILRPQFHPLYERLRFLADVEQGDGATDSIEDSAEELIDFVAALEMGAFYAKRLGELLTMPKRAYILGLGAGPDTRYSMQLRDARREYRQQVENNRSAVVALAVELLRYQRWAHDALYLREDRS